MRNRSSLEILKEAQWGLEAYVTAEGVISLCIIAGNGVVVLLYILIPHLRTVTNTYIFSLAITDFLVGMVGIPIHVYSALTKMPENFYGCMVTNMWIIILCTVSTFHLLVMALDKYVTISFGAKCWSDNKRHRARVSLCGSWIAGIAIGLIPLLGWHAPREEWEGSCEFLKVMDTGYLVYVIFFGTIIPPTVIILFCYLSIYYKIWIQTASIANLIRANEIIRRQKQRKAVIKSLMLVVLAFCLCWFPLYTLNTVVYFDPTLSLPPAAFHIPVLLSHASCAINPVIYAYGLPGFKRALTGFFKGQSIRQIRHRRSLMVTTDLPPTRGLLVNSFRILTRSLRDRRRSTAFDSLRRLDSENASRLAMHRKSTSAMKNLPEMIDMLTAKSCLLPPATPSAFEPSQQLERLSEHSQEASSGPRLHSFDAQFNAPQEEALRETMLYSEFDPIEEWKGEGESLRDSITEGSWHTASERSSGVKSILKSRIFSNLIGRGRRASDRCSESSESGTFVSGEVGFEEELPPYWRIGNQQSNLGFCAESQDILTPRKFERVRFYDDNTGSPIRSIRAQPGCKALVHEVIVRERCLSDDTILSISNSIPDEESRKDTPLIQGSGRVGPSEFQPTKEYRPVRRSSQPCFHTSLLKNHSLPTESFL